MKIDVLIERTLFASRWLLAPIYLSLSGLLLIFTIVIVSGRVDLAVEVPTIGEVELSWRPQPDRSRARRRAHYQGSC
jgi:uncharacterized protein (TIGR00645 family)